MGVVLGVAERTLFEYPGQNAATLRTFRLKRPLPVCAEFYAMSYMIDVWDQPGTGGGEFLMVYLPWQTKREGRELTHAGFEVISRALHRGFDVHVPSISEVLFLRLARQGDAEELAGPHCLIPWKDHRLNQGHFRYAAFWG